MKLVKTDAQIAAREIKQGKGAEAFRRLLDNRPRKVNIEPSASPRINAELIITVKRRGTVLTKYEGNVLTGGIIIGRQAQTSNVIIDQQNISKTHAKIEIDEGKIILTDLGSTIGTFFNGSRIKKIDITSNPKFRLAYDVEVEVAFDDAQYKLNQELRRAVKSFLIRHGIEITQEMDWLTPPWEDDKKQILDIISRGADPECLYQEETDTCKMIMEGKI